MVEPEVKGTICTAFFQRKVLYALMYCTYATQSKLINIYLNMIYVLNCPNQRLHITLNLSDIIANILCGLNY
jgi:hypothetical protein